MKAHEAARTILDEIAYVVLATADADGTPWASPVWFAADRYDDIYWISSPEAQHSRNIAARADIGLVAFDSRIAPAVRQAVYMRATAARIDDPEAIAHGVTVFSSESVRQGLDPLEAAEIVGDAKLRLYHARVLEHFVLAHDHDVRIPVRP